MIHTDNEYEALMKEYIDQNIKLAEALSRVYTLEQKLKRRTLRGWLFG